MVDKPLHMSDDFLGMRHSTERTCMALRRHRCAPDDGLELDHNAFCLLGLARWGRRGVALCLNSRKNSTG